MTQDYDRADVDTLPQRLHERRLGDWGKKVPVIGSLSSTTPPTYMGCQKQRVSGKYPLSVTAASTPYCY